MNTNNFFSVLFVFMGLFFAIKFKYVGKTAIQQRKWLNKFLPFKNKQEDFDEFAVMTTQFMSLFIGILFFIIGLSKFFSE